MPTLSYASLLGAYLQVGAGAQDFSYKEFDDSDVLLDREDGYLPGVMLEFGEYWQAGSGAFRVEMFGGNVDYDGQTQTGIPLKTKTYERIRTVEALFRFDIKSFSKNKAQLIVGLGHREWRRDILATNITRNLFEVYRWKYLILGGAGTLWQNGKWSGGINVHWLRPINPTMSVNISGFDNVTLDLGSRNGVRIDFPFQFLTATHRQWAFAPYWETWRLGRSDKRLTISEPRSETNIVGMTISLRL